MEDFPFLQLSAYIGLVATGLLTLNILLGMMLSTAYKKNVYWIKLPDRIKQIWTDENVFLQVYGE